MDALHSHWLQLTPSSKVSILLQRVHNPTSNFGTYQSDSQIYHKVMKPHDIRVLSGSNDRHIKDIHFLAHVGN